MKPLARLLALGLLFSLSVVPRLAYAGHGGDADDYGHKHHQHKHNKDREDEVAYDGPYFTAERATIIRHYYTPEELSGLPPGLRKHLERTGHLPPGLEKRLVFNQTLPPEYVPDLVPAPPDLISQMGPLPQDSRLYFYNGDAILLDPKTQAVVDIVHGVLGLSGH